MSTKRSIRFAESVDPETSVTLTKQVEKDATVEEVRVRIYRGAELALHVYPFVKRDNKRFSLVEFRGKEYVDGDGDEFVFAVSEGVAVEDVIGVEVENTAPVPSDDKDLSYDFAVDMQIDREGGTDRPASSFIDRLVGGVF